MASAPNGGRGNREKTWSNFVEPSKMLTRQGRNSSDMEDERLNEALNAAGIVDCAAMSIEEKQTFLKAILASKEVDSIEIEESHQQNSSGSPSTNPGHSPNSEIYEAQSLNSDVVMEENVARPNRPLASDQPGTSQPPRNAGRGRAKPIKTKYPTLPVNCSPGLKSDLNKPSSPFGSKASISLNLANVMSSGSPSSESAPTVLHNDLPKRTDDIVALSPLSPESQSCIQGTPEIFKPSFSDDVVEAHGQGGTSQGDNDVLLDVESDGPDEGAGCDNEPDSPASVQDVGEDEKEPVKTVLIGNIAAQVSPLETMNRGFPPNGFSNFYQELEKYRGNKKEWMAKANEMVKEHEMALWKKLKEDNPIWGPPITDCGGYKKQTLFKDTTPKYSSLFSNSSEKQAGPLTTGRAERQSKTKAVSKIQDALTEQDLDEPDFEPEFHSLRRSRQNDGKKQDTGSRQPGNPWNRKQQDVEVNDDSCREDASSDADVDKWPSNRLEQRGKSADGDLEFASESPKANRPPDEYKFVDDEEIWEKTKNRKNFKRGGKAGQTDPDFDAKLPQRPRGVGLSQTTQRSTKSSKLRLQKGTIAHPSQHVQVPRQKGGCAEQMEGETNARNSSNNEGRWLRAGSSEIENTPEIPSQNFYSKVVQPRNSTRRSRESGRPDDFSSPPSTSGDSSTKMQCPICGKTFSADKIEAHASDCSSPEAPAVGEVPQRDNEDSEEPDKAVEEVNNTETMQETFACKLCLEQFPDRSKVQAHMVKCVTIHITPSKKRANSIDDNSPMKKTRYLE